MDELELCNLYSKRSIEFLIDLRTVLFVVHVCHRLEDQHMVLGGLGLFLQGMKVIQEF